MKIFSTFITDLDGTLCDTLQANIVSYREAFSDAGLPFDELDYRSHFGLRFDDMFARLAPHGSAAQKKFVATQKSIHYQANAGLVTVNSALANILLYAKMKGSRTGLATTATKKNAQSILSYHGLIDLFDEIIFGEDVQYGKPDPECYNLIMSRLKVRPEQCVIFEDSDSGLQAARRSGAEAMRIVL